MSEHSGQGGGGSTVSRPPDTAVRERRRLGL